jgi:hypothetical protein
LLNVGWLRRLRGGVVGVVMVVDVDSPREREQLPPGDSAARAFGCDHWLLPRSLTN